MECGVCTNTFDSGAAKPRNLSCGHAFCTECLSTIQKNELQKTNLRQIRCPECRTLTPCADVTKLPVNFTLLRLVEEVSEAKAKAASSPPPSSTKPPPTGVKLPAPIPTPTFSTPVKPVSSPAPKPTPPTGFTEVIKPSLPSQTRPSTTSSPPPSSSSSGPKKRTTILHKHELVAKAHSIGWYCDICLQKYEKDTLSWDCDPCGYDICNTCIGPEQKEASPPEPSPSYDSGPISGVGSLCQECHRQPREIRCVACSVEVCTACDTRVHSVSAKSGHKRQNLARETKSREPTFASASEARSYYELMKPSELKSTLEKAGITTIGMAEKSELVDLAMEHFYRPQETKSSYGSASPSSTSSTSSSTTSSSTTSSSSQSYSFTESALPQAVDPMKYEAKLQAKLVEVQKMMITNLKKIMEDFGIPHEGMELGELRLSVAQLLLLNDSGDSGGTSTSDAERERKEKEKRERERQDREEEDQKKRDRERIERERKALSSFTPSVGATVDAKDDQDNWLEAKVLEVHNDYSGKMYSVEYKGFNEMYRGWARDGSVAPFKQFSTWANSEKKAARLFPVGKEVMAKDKKNKFHVATVKTISGMRFYVHFKGYADSHDEWVDSSNLQDHWRKSSAYVSQLQFLTAAQDGKMDVVKSYLEAGGTVEAKTTTAGDTALILAARGNHAAIVRYLIDDYKADVNSVNEKRSTPLIAAAMRGHSSIARTLIENKASVNATTSENDTAMSLAVWQNHTDTAMVLQRNGASCHRIDRFGDTMLLDAAKNGNDELLKMLMDKGLDVNHSNKEGETAGIRAARYGHTSCLSTLLDNGAKIDHQDNTGQTMLHYALLAQHTACVDILVDKSADVDVKDYKGVTPRAIGKVKGARPGMRVRVKTGHTPKYGWGNVKPGEIGTVMVQLGTRVFVDFASQSTAWRGIASELEDVGSLPATSSSSSGDDMAMTLLLAALLAGGGSRCYGCRTSFSSQKDKNECCICKNDFCVTCIQLAKRTRLIGFLIASETVLCCQPCIDKAS